MIRYLIPLALFLGLVVFLAIGLGRDPHKVPSPLLGKPAPAFQLAQLKDSSRTFSPAEMRGKVWLLNVWASWCIACRDEHSMLLEIARGGLVPIYGLNYRDKREDALSWLNELGDPYVLSASDLDARVGMDYGVYGAPESYLIDKQGIIRFKHIGPITPEVWEQSLLPLAKELNR